MTVGMSKPVLPQMPATAVQPVEVLRVQKVRPPHGPGQGFLRMGRGHQADVVGHQAVGMHLPISFLAGFGQGLDEILPVHIVQGYVLPPVTAAHDVVNGARIFDASLAGHEPRQTTLPNSLKRQNRTMLWYVPDANE